MTDEEYIRNRLDMINLNSVYGLMIDTEITKIVRDHIKRDIGCDYDRLNCPKPPIYIGPVVIKTLRDRIIEESTKELQNEVDKSILKEETKMKATSVEVIKNVKDISFLIENDPEEMESKLTIVAGTNDDIFEFDFEGPELIQQCKAAGLFTGWEKDHKIKELEKELGRWKKEAADCLKLRDEAQKEAYKLKKENEHNKEVFTRIKRNSGRYPWDEEKSDEPTDNVNHPSHYTGKYECIDVMQDVFGEEATNDFCLCNAFKYIWRARKKNGLEDVKKAVWYLNKYIEEAENGVRKGEQV